ncbi:hypothetical protein GCM10009854_39220 [Saccharopolyspora halophila]|uniref:PPE domain-containing protein n=1 Tax=Saccharopolyspora halophila TaxID=405551 RepID=A0ABN3GP05_9PSEU
MADIEPIRDIRFEGMDISQLREWISRIKQGAGTESMQSAVRALDSCVQVVTDLDDTLRRELGKLQIAWEGSAGDLAAETTRRQQAMMSEAPDPLARSASSVEGQGQGYESARHKLPNCDELRHQESENVLEWAGGGFGYESDYDAEAKRIDAQKKAAQAALAEYRDTSVDHADGHRPLPVVPAGAVQASQPSGSVPGAGVGAMPSAGDSSGSAVVGGATAGRGTVGDGTTGSAPVPGARPGAGDPVPGARPGDQVSEPGADRPGGGWVDGGRVDGDGRAEPGEPDAPEQPEEPGGSEEPKDPGAPEEHAAELGADGRAAGEDGIGTGTMLGIAAGGAALLGGGAYAAKRVMDGRAGGAAPGGEAKAAKTGGTAAAASGGKAGGGVLSPATKREGGSGDGEHENAYAAEETPFDDERLVAPAVLGDQTEDDRSESEPEAGAGESAGEDSPGEAGDETKNRD